MFLLVACLIPTACMRGKFILVCPIDEIYLELLIVWVKSLKWIVCILIYLGLIAQNPHWVQKSPLFRVSFYALNSSGKFFFLHFLLKKKSRQYSISTVSAFPETAKSSFLLLYLCVSGMCLRPLFASVGWSILKFHVCIWQLLSVNKRGQRASTLTVLRLSWKLGEVTRHWGKSDICPFPVAC